MLDDLARYLVKIFFYLLYFIKEILLLPSSISIWKEVYKDRKVSVGV